MEESGAEQPPTYPKPGALHHELRRPNVCSSCLSPLRKLANVIYREFFTAVKIENFIKQNLIFLKYLHKTEIVGAR